MNYGVKIYPFTHYKNWWVFLGFSLLLVSIFPLNYPQTITTITRHKPLVFLSVAGCGGCFGVFSIWNNMFLGYPWWNIVCRLLGWVPNRTIFIGLVVPLYMTLLVKNLTITYGLTGDHPLYSIPFPLPWLLKPTLFKYFLKTSQLPHYMNSGVKDGLETSPWW